MKSIQLKPIYVSLNGISTITGLYHAIWKQIYPILNSRGANVLKLVFGGAIKAVSKCIIDLNGDGNQKLWTDDDGISYVGVIPFLIDENNL